MIGSSQEKISEKGETHNETFDYYNYYNKYQNDLSGHDVVMRITTVPALYMQRGDVNWSGVWRCLDSSFANLLVFISPYLDKTIISDNTSTNLMVENVPCN